MVTGKITNLGDFILNEMKQRQMSARAFAEFIDVTHSTINKFVDFGKKDVGYPSIEFLIKLAKATKTDIRTLIALVVPPEVLEPSDVSPESILLSQRIEQLPEQYREVIDSILAKITK